MTLERVMGVLFLLGALFAAVGCLYAFYMRFIVGTGPTDAVVVAALLSLGHGAFALLFLVGVSRAKSRSKRSRNMQRYRRDD